MSKSPFVTFLETHRPSTECRKVPSARVKDFEAIFPQPLLQHWQAEGWCGYADGLLWVVDPHELEDPLKEWLEKEYEPAWAFARTAFGDVLFWHDEKAYYLHVLYGKVAELTDDLELLFEYTLCQDSYLNKVVDRKLFKKALARLGSLASDECYAFVPAIAMGGSSKVNTIEKAKLREHLSFLAQL